MRGRFPACSISIEGSLWGATPARPAGCDGHALVRSDRGRWSVWPHFTRRGREAGDLPPQGPANRGREREGGRVSDIDPESLAIGGGWVYWTRAGDPFSAPID